MIFVTVGTHEDPFDRLVEAIDRLKGEGRIRREVFMQTGYSTYRPRFCQYKDFIPFREMTERMEAAEIVITHGGTGSIMLVLYHNKIPIVVPRQKKYREHIDDHQVLFCRTMEKKGKIIPVYETSELETVIANYHQNVQQLRSIDPIAEELLATKEQLDQRAAVFAERLHEICINLMKKKIPK
jgi:UDP-N-acetylglucosamine transferase subunit ALG13